MSSKGTIDILLNIESFRNIDLYYQGLYFIQFQVYQELNTKKIYACPYDFQNTFDDILSMHSIFPGQILEQISSYSTKIFMIKYSDEIVNIHETVIFRIEACLFSNPDLLIEAELFFTDLSGDLSPESISKFIHKPEVGQNFVKASSCLFRSSNWKFGVNQFCPVVFQDTYASVAKISVHTILLDYKFKLDDNEITDFSQIGHCFFPLCGKNVPDDNINRIFKDYVLTLASCSNKSRRLMKKVLKTIKSPNSQKKKLKHQIKPPLTFDADANGISKSLTTRNKKKITKILLTEIKEVASMVYQMRFDLGNILKYFSKEVVDYLEEKYHDKVRKISMEHIYREIQIGELNIVSEMNPSQATTARAHRNSMYSMKREHLEIYNTRIFSAEKLAVMFEEINIKTGEFEDCWKSNWFCNNKMSREKHLIVLVHGYMGSNYDMKAVRDALILYKSQLLILLSESNEKYTEGNIADMGARLATEVTTYILSLPNSIILSKISFIGHSLGGIIIRAALPHLLEFKKVFGFYISLASPHLGCSQFSNKLVEAGLWILAKIRNSTCIQQLTLKDSLNPRNSFLYGLAKNSKLHLFEKVVLVSSSQDAYVPYESARIEIGMESPDMIQLEMADSIAGKIQQLHRINVDFPIKSSVIQNLHGRAAHISLLDSQSFLNILIYRYADLLGNR